MKAILPLALAARVVAQDCMWSEQHPKHLPDYYGNVSMAYDSTRSATVMFAIPPSKNHDLRETVEWNGSDWLLQSVEGPPGGSDFSMAFDSWRGVTVWCGGFEDDCDTWEWNGDQWQFRFAGVTARRATAVTFDFERGVTVLFGGVYNTNNDIVELGDTWEWDGEQWSKVAEVGPSPRYNPAMAYDEARHVTVLYGGAGKAEGFSDTWEWDGQSWTKRADNGPLGVRYRSAMVYDRDLHACVCFGGVTSDYGATDDTWMWDGQSWTQIDTPACPPARRGHAMAYDSAHHGIVLFGGTDGGPDFFYNDTWEFTCTPPCYPDLDGNGILDLFDFLAFVNAFNAGDTSPSDCDHSGALDLFDFLCFTNAFNAGC